jgi:hypothetical protein
MAWIDYDFSGAGVWPPTSSTTTDTPSVTLVESSTLLTAQTERLAPDAILVQTAQAGVVSSIQDDPDSPDANYLTGTSATAAELRVSFPTPANALLAGFTQEFRVRVRPRP